MSALRLARAATGRDKIVKFAGGYHGHSDGLLAKAGSGMATLGIPSSPGVPESFSSQTLVVPYNDPDSLARTFSGLGGQIAAVIVEPIAANMGVALPDKGYLEFLRTLTREHGSLLIFDEVITGFRVHYGGAQTLYGISPDLTCLGKIIGGGLPVGAFGGRREIMDMLAPDGAVYQAGTHSGNPVVMAAGVETLKILGRPGTYARLDEESAFLENGLAEAAEESAIGVKIARLGSLFTIFFTRVPVRDFETALQADAGLYAKFFHRMLAAGIYLPPSQFEAAFVSTAHTRRDLRATVEAARKALRAIARG
jgi:glutamate-1-semialdehyde 2,1-aminomutase